jgi:hypothetical protein
MHHGSTSRWHPSVRVEDGDDLGEDGITEVYYAIQFTTGLVASFSCFGYRCTSRLPFAVPVVWGTRASADLGPSQRIDGHYEPETLDNTEKGLR